MSAVSRTYGGWRRRRGIGLFGLGTGGTLAVLAVAGVLILLAAIAPGILLYLLPPVLVAAMLGLLRIHEVPVGYLAWQRLRWWIAKARSRTRYVGGVTVDHPWAFELPGVLAGTQLLDAEDGFGSRYGLVRDRRTGYLTATIRVVPASTWLADRDDADTWVASWGAWLAGLGHQPMVRWVSVTVDTAPEPGSTLADAVAGQIEPAAPEPARRILGELVQGAPAAAADVDTRVSITIDPSAAPAPPKTLTDAVAEAGRVLAGLEDGLGACGVTVLGRATAAELSGVVRTAFDPHARGEINRMLAHGGGDLDWSQAGPVWAEEEAESYRHDGGHSVTWAWQEAPRTNVHADVLARLVAPAAHPKRVTLQYRPFPAAAATRQLENEVNAASFRSMYRRRTGRDESARDVYDQARAQQAAGEEAMGAGVGLLSMIVTVTVTSQEELPRAVSAVEAAAEASRIRLRRMWGSQAAGFAATLPCGICPADLARRWPH